MIIRKIKLKQYGSYKGEEELILADGMTGIVGKYDATAGRSNASGKSTLIRSSLYALYGEDEGKTVDEYINDQIEKDKIDMFVSVWFDHNTKSYLVTRGRKKASPYLYFAQISDGVENELGDKETNITAKQKLINECIGMDFDMFTATVFFQQRQADKFINTEAGKSQEYLDSVLKLEILREAIKKGNTKVNKAVELVKSIKDVIKTVSDQIAAFDIEIGKKVEVQKKIEDETLKCTENSMLLSNLESQIKDSENESKLVEIADGLLARLTSIKQLIVSDTAKISADQATIEVNDKSIISWTNQIDATIAKKAETDTNLQQISTQVKDIYVIKQTLSNDIATSTAERQSTLSFISNLSDPLCPHCHQNITDDYKSATIDLINRNADLLSEKIATLTSQLKDVTNSVNELSIKQSAFVALSHNYDTEISMHRTNIRNATNNNESLRDSLTECNKTLTHNSELVLNVENEYNTAKVRAENAKGVDVASLRRSMVTIKMLVDQATAAISQLNRQIGAIEEKENTRSQLNDHLITQQAKQIEIEEILASLQIAVTVFKGMIEDKFNSSVKLIEYYANDLIQNIYSNFQISIFKDKTKKSEPLTFQFLCDGHKRSYARLSGGQKTVADICLRLGFSRTLIDMSNAKINFIALDEPFESLDEYNRELVKQILKLESSIFSQILVISHTPDANDFDHTIHVQMTSDGTSYLK